MITEQDQDAFAIPHLRDYWFTIVKRKKIIIISVILTALMGLLSTGGKQQVYVASVKIMICTGQEIYTSRGSVKGISFYNRYGVERYENEYEVMRSSAVNEIAAGILGWEGKERVKYVRGAVSVNPVYSGYNATNTANIVARSMNPKEAMDMANALAKAYIRSKEEGVRIAVKRAYDIYAQQLDEVKIKIRDGEKALNKLRKRYGLAGADETEEDTKKAQDLRNRLEAELIGLLAVYTEKHPRVIQKKLQLEELQKMLRTGSIIDSPLADSRLKRSEIGFLKSKYYALRQELRSNQELYKNMITSMKEMNVFEEMSKIEDVKVLEWATLPRLPVKAGKLMAFSFPFVGLLLGVCLAFFLEYMDNTIKRPEDVKQYLGLNVLGVIPHVEDRTE